MTIELDKRTIPALIRRSVSLYRDLPAIAFVGEPPLTYSQVAQETEALAGRLLRCNIGKGDTVTILGENSPQWVLAYLAVTSIGAVAVPVLPGFPDSDIRHIIRDSESVAAFVSDKQRPKLDSDTMPRVRVVFNLEDFTVEYLKPSRPGFIDKAKHLFHRKENVAPAEPGVMGGVAAASPGDVAVILYTSGTTGHSKGVLLTHSNIVSDAIGSIERFPIDRSDCFLSVLPLSHTYEATGGMLCPLAAGVSIFYMKGLPAPTRLLQAMQVVKPTGVLMVPLIIESIYRKRILRQIRARRLAGLYRIPLLRKWLNRWAGKRLIKALGGRLRFLLIGGAALGEDVETFLRDAAIGYSTGYGMTEASPILTISPFGSVKPGSVGLPIPGVEIKILEPDPDTGVGEIVARGPNIMKGYYRNEEMTQAAFLQGGWLKTGDLGCVDGDGCLFIKGRSKNVIVDPSGENIYPEIIEQQLLKSPYVHQAIVYQHAGKLTARVHLDSDLVDQEIDRHELTDSEARVFRQKMLMEIKTETNRQVPAFSAIKDIIEHPEPFELTPTKKIKRYLYTN